MLLIRVASERAERKEGRVVVVVEAARGMMGSENRALGDLVGEEEGARGRSSE